LVIRSLLTQEGICMTLEPEFHFLEVAYPYVARCVAVLYLFLLR
jgi:predicted unusual protein kinase regulating ubiquinone biosynthesis (AarF/ABC1/UbiB family)